MKKSIKYLTFVSIAILVGCKAKDDIAPNWKTIDIKASCNENQSKSSLGTGNKILWQTDENISVFDGKSNCKFVLTSGAGTSNGVFSGTISETAKNIHFASPFTESASLSSNSISGLTMPSNQNANESSFDPSTALMVGFSSNVNSATFHHISAYLKVTPKFDCSEISVVSNNGTTLAGVISVEQNSDGTPKKINVTSNASSEICLTGDIKSGKSYLIGLLPGTHSKGFTICFTRTDGKRYSKTKSENFTFSSGKIINLGALNSSSKWDALVSRTAIALVSGDKFNLSPGVALSSKSTWVSSDPSVADVNGTEVIAKNPGSCVISANVGDVSLDCAITVIASSSDVFRYGYSELNSVEKEVYDYMLKRVMAFEANKSKFDNYMHRVYLDLSSFKKFIVSSDNVMRLTSLIIKDVPEAYFIQNYIYRYDYDSSKYYIRIEGTQTPEGYASNMSAIYSSVKNIITKSGTEFERAKYIHDAFANLVSYGNMTSPRASSIVGGFIDKKIVCEGYARSYLFLCQQANLKAMYISGSMKTSDVDNTWVNHAWNLMKINDSWYMTDITSEDGLVSAQLNWKWFLRGQAEATRIHKFLNTSNEDTNTGKYGYSTLPTLSEEDYPMQR